MRLPISPADFSCAVVALFPVAVEDWSPKTALDGTPKTSPVGSPLFRCSAAKVVLLDESGKPVREERGASIAVVRPSAIDPGTPLYLDGRVWATPYVTDAGRLGLSLVAESLSPNRPGTQGDSGTSLPRLTFAGKDEAA